MFISHNLQALNAQNNLKKNTNNLKKNLEKLSSGYRINRAGDDAAGLAISEGLRALINGTSQAERNVQDGIGLVQTAEGAMQEIHAMLNRANQLCIASANGTYDAMDRGAMEEELTQMKAEIQRITDHTEFNGVHLLQSKAAGGIEAVEILAGSGLPSWVGTDQSMADGHLTQDYTTTETYTDALGADTDYSIRHAAAKLDFSSFSAANRSELVGKGFFATCYTCERHYSICFTNDTTNSVTQSGSHFVYNIGIGSITNGTDLVQAIIAGTNKGYPHSHYTKLAAEASTAGGGGGYAGYL